MRIIAGSFKSRIIVTPHGLETRPTQGKIRGSLFNIIARRCQDAHVLDLFAGSGALAFEAVSRGAAFAVLCDLSNEASRAIESNINVFHAEKTVRFMHMDWQSAIRQLTAEKVRFDLIFLDPPYKMSADAPCEQLVDGSLLAENSLIVVEHNKKTPPALSGRFQLIDIRHYGDTSISFLSLSRQHVQEQGEI